MTRVLPRTLRGRLVLLVLVTLAAAQAVSLWAFVDERGLAVRAALAQEAAGRAANVARLIEASPPSLHAAILRAAGSPLVRFGLADAPAVDHADHDAGAAADRIRALLDDDARRDVRVELHRLPTPPDHPPRGMEAMHRAMMARHGERYELRLSIGLSGGRWLNVETRFHRPAVQLPRAAALNFALTAALLGAVVWIALSRLTSPLSRLTAAADRFGRGEATHVRPAGPAELRSLTEAFNDMQDRLTRSVSERARLLAALGHDLRSPLTAMRVRAEMVEDGETRERLILLVEEMQEMVEATLAFARGAAGAEASETVDVARLVRDIAADAEAVGGRAEVAAAPDSASARVKPVALRRALRNLIDNAVRYGGGARIAVERTGGALRITVSDDGPGIPEADLERVFDPFVRLEASRSRETGGAGLGLSIARSVALAHGGDLRLANRPGGGLDATLTLPLGEDPSPT